MVRSLLSLVFALVAVAPVASAEVLVNDPVLDATSRDTQSGASLIVIPPSTVVAVYNDTGSYVAPPLQHLTGYSRSTDGGLTFTDLGRLPDSANGDVGYPVLARNAATGRIFLATLPLSSFNSTSIFHSDDGGLTWQGPVSVFNTGEIGPHWIAVDNAPGPGQGYLYVVASDDSPTGGMRLARSTDNGLNFANMQTLASGGVLPHVTIGPDHAIYVFWLEGNQLRMRASTDLGANFASATTVATLASTGPFGDLGIGFRTRVWLQAQATATPGVVVATWADRGLAPGDRADIYHSVSADYGATWSVPARVNDDSTTRDQAVPTIAVTQDRTRLAIGWYDRRSDPANSLLEYRVRTATVEGSTIAFSPSVAVSSGTFAAIYGQDAVLNATYFVDFDQATADDTHFYFAWADTRLASAAHAQQPDVRMAKVLAPPTPPLFANGFE